MPPHQHGEVGIGIVDVRPMKCLFARQYSATFTLLLQELSFLDHIIALSSPFANTTHSAWVGIWILTWTIDDAAKFGIRLA